MMNFFRPLRRRLAVALACAAGLGASAVRADLVWTPDQNTWRIEGGVLAPFFGDVGETASALEASS